MPELELRPLADSDEAVARKGHEAMKADGFEFLLDYEEGEPWPGLVQRHANFEKGIDLGPRVPATFLLAWVGGEMVGRTSIRHTLNAKLLEIGGHIGYGVLPQYRRKGYATTILRQSLTIVGGHGVTDALVTCDVENVGSRTVIESCGGKLDDIREGKRRYWIALQ